MARRDCRRCYGFGLIFRRDGIIGDALIRIGPAYVNPVYPLLLMCDFPDVVFQAQENGELPVHFRFLGGDGIIMPMVP